MKLRIKCPVDKSTDLLSKLIGLCELRIWNRRLQNKVFSHKFMDELIDFFVHPYAKREKKRSIAQDTLDSFKLKTYRLSSSPTSIVLKTID